MFISIDIKDKTAKRSMIPANFELTDWESIKPYIDMLLSADPKSIDELIEYLKRISEVQAVVSEEEAWRFIRMTTDTRNQEYVDSYQYFVTQVSPQVTIFFHKIHQKLILHPLFEEVEQNYSDFFPYLRALKNEIALFREENVAIQAEAKSLAQQFGAISGEMTIEHDSQTLTTQQAAKWLEKKDRDERQIVWEKVRQRRLQDREKLHKLLDDLIQKRHQIAVNAGFSSYTEYKFREMGRFDYQLSDTQTFHHAIEVEAKPVLEQLLEERERKLDIAPLRPWDLHIDIFGDEPLRPFDKPHILTEKTVKLLSSIKPELGSMLQLMDKKGFLDLENRPGKSPGGYNYPLQETGIPFIFMNATGTQDDITTILHESGHAIHSFLIDSIPLVGQKDTPSEVAELASMSMELMALDYYDIIYPDPAERNRSKKTQLSRTISVFSWVATVDAFQQWLYIHPNHTHEEREEKWVELYRRFQGDKVDWSGYEDSLRILWQKQLHIYEVPFYYIEYAIAQLGAIAIWKRFKEDPDQGLNDYLAALKLGYTKTIPEIYEAAGISFDFSSEYVKSCLTFCLEQYQKLS